MRATWRWFGPDDRVSLRDIAQAGAQGVVTALHHIAPGEVWSAEEIARRQSEVARLPDGRPSGLAWEVVESLPVSEEIKTGGPEARAHVRNYIESLANIAAAGIKVVCYNFMPVLDWTRTELAWELPNGARAMRFDLIDFAGFDIAILGRPGAEADYPQDVVEAARARAAGWAGDEPARLAHSILAGLPGAAEHWTRRNVHEALARYRGIDAERLRANFRAFLEAVVPEAEALGVRLCCHPDDPPWPLLGLPRVVSTEADYRWLVEAVPSPANGITLCTGSLGARADNDLPGMMRRLGPHVHFLHLRNVTREGGGVPCSFFEDEHLAGDTDMVAVVAAALAEERRRRAEGRSDAEIPMRPDHGQEILNDPERGAAPGYPAIGRLKGLAELRGVARALAAGEAAT